MSEWAPAVGKPAPGLCVRPAPTLASGQVFATREEAGGKRAEAIPRKAAP